LAIRNLFSLRGCGIVALVVVLAPLAALLVRFNLRTLEAERVFTDSTRFIDASTLPVEFTVAAYNVQARPTFDDTTVKFQEISPLMNEWDLVAIQECFYNHEDLWEGADHPYKYFDNTIDHPFRLVNSGLSILHRIKDTSEAEHVEILHFSHSGDFQNWPASKGILMTRHEFGDVTLDFYNTHMAAGRKERSQLGKRVQTRELIDFVQEHSPPEHVVIFAGDFNMRPVRAGEPPLDDYSHDLDGLDRNQLFDVIRKETGLIDVGEQLNGPVYNGVDHVLYRSGTTATLEPLSWKHDTETFFAEDGTPLSDHEPIIVRFRLSARETASD